MDKRNAVVDEIARRKLSANDTDPAMWPAWYNQPGKNKGKERLGRWVLLTDGALDHKVKHSVPTYLICSSVLSECHPHSHPMPMQIRTGIYCKKYHTHKAKEVSGKKVDWWVGMWLVE